MKATHEQRDRAKAIVATVADYYNMPLRWVTVRFCWQAFDVWDRHASWPTDDDWPYSMPRLFSFQSRTAGTLRGEEFPGLNDGHLETVFKSIVKEWNNAR